MIITTSGILSGTTPVRVHKVDQDSLASNMLSTCFALHIFVTILSILYHQLHHHVYHHLDDLVANGDANPP